MKKANPQTRNRTSLREEVNRRSGVMHIPKNAEELLSGLAKKARRCRELCEQHDDLKTDGPSLVDCGLAGDQVYAAVEALKYLWAGAAVAEHRVSLVSNTRNYKLRITGRGKQKPIRLLSIPPTLGILFKRADAARVLRVKRSHVAIDRESAMYVEKMAVNLVEYLPALLMKDETEEEERHTVEEEDFTKAGRPLYYSTDFRNWWLGTYPLKLSTQQMLLLEVLVKHGSDPEPLAWESIKEEEHGLSTRSPYDIFHANNDGRLVWNHIDRSQRRYRLKAHPQPRIDSTST